MAEIVTIPDKIRTSDIPDSELNTIGKFSKKVIHHNAGPPTVADDTGLGYAVGSIWVDSTNGDTYTAVTVTAEDANWKNMEGDNINDPFEIGVSNCWYSGGMRDGTGRPGGGDYSAEEVNVFPVASSGNATDVGETDTTTHSAGSSGTIHDTTYVYLAGGAAANHPTTNAGGAKTSEINRSGIVSPVSFTDIGDLDAGTTANGAAGTDGTSGFVAAGRQPSVITQIDKFSLASPSTTVDTGGDLTAANYYLGGYSDCLNSKIFISGGLTPSATNTIESFPTAISSGTSSDYGELSMVRSGHATCASTTHAITMGGFGSGDAIEKFPFTAPTSNTDVGELIQSKNSGGGVGSPDSTAAAFHIGGKDSPMSTIDEIDKFSLSSPGSASDWGNLIEKTGEGYASGV